MTVSYHFCIIRDMMNFRPVYFINNTIRNMGVLKY